MPAGRLPRALPGIGRSRSQQPGNPEGRRATRSPVAGGCAPAEGQPRAPRARTPLSGPPCALRGRLLGGPPPPTGRPGGIPGPGRRSSWPRRQHPIRGHWWTPGIEPAAQARTARPQASARATRGGGSHPARGATASATSSSPATCKAGDGWATGAARGTGRAWSGRRLPAAGEYRSGCSPPPWPSA